MAKYSGRKYIVMEKAIRDCIETAAEGSGYILASGCEMPMDSTEDRIDHFFPMAVSAGGNSFQP